MCQQPADSDGKWTDTQTASERRFRCPECSQLNCRRRPTPPTGVTSPRHYCTGSHRTIPGWPIFWPRTAISAGLRKKIQKRSCNRQTVCQSDGMQAKPTELEIETSKRLWAAAEIMAAEITDYAVQEIVRAFFRGEDMNAVLAAYLGEDLHGLSMKSPQVINETLQEKRL